MPPITQQGAHHDVGTSQSQHAGTSEGEQRRALKLYCTMATPRAGAGRPGPAHGRPLPMLSGSRGHNGGGRVSRGRRGPLAPGRCYEGAVPRFLLNISKRLFGSSSQPDVFDRFTLITFDRSWMDVKLVLFSTRAFPAFY